MDNNKTLGKRPADIISKLVLEGDLSKLTGPEKVEYYKRFCESLGLNPLTRPFQLIEFEGKLVLYPTKDCTEQLRKINEVSIFEITTQEIKGLFVVTAKARDKSGKVDVSTAAISMTKEEKVWIDNPPGSAKKGYYKKTGKKIFIEGEEFANLIMKAETKAKRRVTLSICGLGSLEDSPGGESFLDEKFNPDEVVVRREEEHIENPEKGEILPTEQRNKLTDRFAGLGILKGDIEEKIGKKLFLMTQKDYDAIGKIYKAVKVDQATALAKFRETPYVLETIEIQEVEEVKSEPLTTQETTAKAEEKKEEPPAAEKKEEKPLI